MHKTGRRPLLRVGLTARRNARALRPERDAPCGPSGWTGAHPCQGAPQPGAPLARAPALTRAPRRSGESGSHGAPNHFQHIRECPRRVRASTPSPRRTVILRHVGFAASVRVPHRPGDLARMDAFDEVGLDGLHVLHAGRQIDGNQAGPGARRDTPRSGRPIASAPLRVALSSSRAGAIAGARWCSAASSLNRLGRTRWPGCRCRWRRGRRRRRSARPAGCRRRPRVAARTGDDRRPRRRQPRQFGIGALDAVHGEERRADDAEPIEILDRPARRRRPARIPGASGVEHVAPGAARRCGGTRPRRATRRRGC